MRSIQSLKRCDMASHAGFSLIELMVGLTLSLLLLAGLITVVTNTNQSYREMSLAGQQIENGRYAIELLSDDIQHAGFYGSLRAVGDPPATLPDPCATDTATLTANYTLAIQGYDAPASSSLSCVPAAQHKPGTDILVIRRAATTVEGGTLESSTHYLQANTQNSVLDTGGSGNLTLTYQDGTTVAPIYRYITHIYFVSPCKLSTCDNTSENIPTLKRLELNSGSFTTVPLVDGVDDLQLDYGIDSDADGSPDTFVTAPTAAQFSDTVAIELHLLARNTELTAGHVDEKKYDMGLAGVKENFLDSYKRHVYSTMVRAVNIAGRREK